MPVSRCATCRKRPLTPTRATVEHGTLTIRAERAPHYGESEQVIAAERPQGAFTRQLSLGEGVDSEHLTAGYADGVLARDHPCLTEGPGPPGRGHPSGRRQPHRLGQHRRAGLGAGRRDGRQRLSVPVPHQRPAGRLPRPVLAARVAPLCPPGRRARALPRPSPALPGLRRPLAHRDLQGQHRELERGEAPRPLRPHHRNPRTGHGPHPRLLDRPTQALTSNPRTASRAAHQAIMKMAKLQLRVEKFIFEELSQPRFVTSGRPAQFGDQQMV